MLRIAFLETALLLGTSVSRKGSVWRTDCQGREELIVISV